MKLIKTFYMCNVFYMCTVDMRTEHISVLPVAKEVKKIMEEIRIPKF